MSEDIFGRSTWFWGPWNSFTTMWSFTVQLHIGGRFAIERDQQENRIWSENIGVDIVIQVCRWWVSEL